MWKAVALIALAGGCYDPSLESCRVACASTEDCAPDQTCTAAKLCATEATTCDPATSEQPDAGTTVSGLGDYTLTLTNADNGCRFPQWHSGDSSMTPFTLSATGAMLVGEPHGPMATVLDQWLGAHTFIGAAHGAALALTLTGTKPAMQRDCTYTFDATLDATIAGAMLSGTLTYRPRTTGDCGDLTDCTTTQELHGVRSNR